MGKKAAGLVCIFLLMVILTGCQLIRIEEGERTPLKYTIVKQEEIPAEEKAGSEPSYPCIVLKIAETKKPVEFSG